MHNQRIQIIHQCRSPMFMALNLIFKYILSLLVIEIFLEELQ